MMNPISGQTPPIIPKNKRRLYAIDWEAMRKEAARKKEFNNNTFSDNTSRNRNKVI